MMRFLLFAATTLVFAGGPAIARDEEPDPPGYRFPRERDAWYIADFLPEGRTLELGVIRETKVFHTRDAREMVGTLAAGQKVNLEGFTRFAYRVRGKNVRGDIIVGWVNPRDMEPPQEDLQEKLIATAERQEQVAQVIAEKRVVVGMTLAEVRRSWGEPTRRERRVDGGGRQDVWEYIVFERVPRFNHTRDPVTGQVYQQISHYEQIEREKNTVEFNDGVVTSVTEREQQRRPRGISLVPVPIIWWP